MKFKMKNKVRILTSKKIDGRYNEGIIIGMELIENGFYLGYSSKKEYLNRFLSERYKVAYVDCVTERAGTDWFSDIQLEKK